MIEAFKTVVFQNYANLNGRARRREYWMFYLAYLVFSIVIGFIGGIMDVAVGEGVSTLLTAVYSIALIIPNIAVTVRRLHDTNRSGKMFLIAMIPIIGWIILFVFLCQREQLDQTSMVSIQREAQRLRTRTH